MSLLEKLFDIFPVSENVKTAVNVHSTVNDINNRIQNGEDADDAANKTLLSSLLSGPLDAYYTKTVLEQWDKLDPVVKSTLEDSVSNLWNSIKALKNEASPENIENFFKSAKDVASRNWKTIGKRLFNAQEEEAVELSLEEVEIGTDAGGEVGGIAGTVTGILTLVVATAGIAMGDKAISEIVDKVYDGIGNDKYIEFKAEMDAGMLMLDTALATEKGFNFLKEVLNKNLDIKENAFTDENVSVEFMKYLADVPADTLAAKSLMDLLNDYAKTLPSEAPDVRTTLSIRQDVLNQSLDTYNSIAANPGKYGLEDPLIIDLDVNGIETISKESSFVYYDFGQDNYFISFQTTEHTKYTEEFNTAFAYFVCFVVMDLSLSRAYV